MVAPDFPIVDEIAQFAAFPEGTRRYISEALAIALNPAHKFLAGSLWESAVQMARADVYHSIPAVRERIAEDGYKLETWANEFGLLHRYAMFDVRYDEMSDFKAFVFLYERLLGPAVRPWLLSVYLAAAGSPLITEEGREERLSGLTAYDVALDFVDLPAPKYFPGLETSPPTVG